MRRLGSSITAAATTGPNNDPRPASSRPAIRCQPHLRASSSNRDEHCLLIAADSSTDRRNSLQPVRVPVAAQCNPPISKWVPSKERPHKQKAREEISRALEKPCLDAELYDFVSAAAVSGASTRSTRCRRAALPLRPRR